MRLFHFSDVAGISTFLPRPVRIPSARPPGREWLNGPLVWAIDDWHQPLYLFPRDCPRVLLWPTATTIEADRARWWHASTARMIAYVEWRWLREISTAAVVRYEMPLPPFDNLHDAGMWVSRQTVDPIAAEQIDDLPQALAQAGVELRAMESLAPLKNVWSTTLHASGIRLRNAEGW